MLVLLRKHTKINHKELTKRLEIRSWFLWGELLFRLERNERITREMPGIERMCVKLTSDGAHAANIAVYNMK